MLFLLLSILKNYKSWYGHYTKRASKIWVFVNINLDEAYILFFFCHFFKKMTGKNFVDYVNDVRIGNATRRLYETTDSISEICYSCGFNNTSNFIRVFKKKRGETPSEYRSGTRKIMKKY